MEVSFTDCQDSGSQTIKYTPELEQWAPLSEEYVATPSNGADPPYILSMGCNILFTACSTCSMSECYTCISPTSDCRWPNTRECKSFGTSGLILNDKRGDLGEFICYEKPPGRNLLINWAITSTLEFSLADPTRYSSLPSNFHYIVGINGGAAMGDRLQVVPFSFTNTISIFSVASSGPYSLPLSFTPSGSSPMTLFYFSFTDSWSTTSYMYVYQKFTFAPTWVDMVALKGSKKTASMAHTLNNNDYIVVTLYARPGISNDFIGFQVSTNDDVQTYINGQSQTFAPVSGTVSGTIQPTPNYHTDPNYLYIVYIIFRPSNTGNFNIVPVANSNDQALIFTGSDFLVDFEYTYCAAGYNYDPSTGTCVTTCPTNYILKNQTCFNPCKDNDPNLNCKAAGIALFRPDLTDLCNNPLVLKADSPWPSNPLPGLLPLTLVIQLLKLISLIIYPL